VSKLKIYLRVAKHKNPVLFFLFSLLFVYMSPFYLFLTARLKSIKPFKKELITLILFTVSALIFQQINGNDGIRASIAVIFVPLMYYAGATVDLSFYKNKLIPFVHISLYIVLFCFVSWLLYNLLHDQPLFHARGRLYYRLWDCVSGLTAAVTVHATYGAFVMAPLFAWLVVKSDELSSFVKTSTIIGTLVYLIYSLLMGRRFSFVALALLVIVAIITLILKKGGYKKLLLIAAVAFIGGLVLYIGDLMEVSTCRRLINTLSNMSFPRFTIWGGGLARMVDEPWGIDAASKIKVYKGSLVHYHNTWIDSWRWFGVVPAALLVLFSIKVSVDIVRSYFAAGNFESTLALFFNVVLLFAWMYEPIMDGYLPLWCLSFYFWGVTHQVNSAEGEPDLQIPKATEL